MIVLPAAEKHSRAGMIKNNKAFFNPWETIHESNPQEILDREEKITFVPFLIMQAALDACFAARGWPCHPPQIRCHDAALTAARAQG